MLSIISMLLPPLCFVILFNRNYKKEYGVDYKIVNNDKTSFILLYLVAVLVVNTLCMVVTGYLFGKDDILMLMNRYSKFATKYIFMSVTFAVIGSFLPILKKKLDVKIVKPQFKIINKALPILYLLVLFSLTFVRVFDNSFWGDECFSIMMSKKDLFEMIDYTAHDVHPPLYYIILAVFYNIFGASGVVYHIISIIPYLILLVFAMTALRRQFGVQASLLFMTFTSLMYSAIVYNLEVRMYSWAAMFALLAFYFEYKILKANVRRDWFLFSVFSLAAAYTHYYALITVAFFYIVLILYAIKEKTYGKNMVGCCSGTVLAYLPWLLVLLDTFKRTSESFWSTKIPTFGESLEFIFDSEIIKNGFIMLFILFVVIETKLFTINKKSEGGKIEVTIGTTSIVTSPELLWCLSGILAMVGTILVGILVSNIFRPLFLLRYLYPSAVVIWLVYSCLASRFRYKSIVTGILIVLIWSSNWSLYQDVRTQEKDLNQSTMTFLETVLIDEAGEIYTNHLHSDWTMLQYYYPKNESTLTYNELTVAEEVRAGDCVLWTQPLSGTCIEEISRNGYSIELIHQGVLGVDEMLYVYQVAKD